MNTNNYAINMKRWLSAIVLSLVALLHVNANTGDYYYYRATADISPTGSGKVYVTTTASNDPAYQGTAMTITGRQYSYGNARVEFHYYAQPNEDYIFDHWARGNANGATVSTDAHFSVTETVTSNDQNNRTSFTYYAVFKEQTGLVKVYTSDANRGSVTIDNLENAIGDDVTLTALPDVANGVIFLGWSKGSASDTYVSTDNPYTFTVSDATKGNYYAMFSAPKEQVYCRMQNAKTGRFLSIYGNQRAGNHQGTMNNQNFNDGFVFTSGLKLIDPADAQGNPTTVFYREGHDDGIGHTSGVNLTSQGTSYIPNLVTNSYPITVTQVGAGIYKIYTTISVNDSGNTINLSSYLCDEGGDWAVMKTDSEGNPITENEDVWYVYILDENTTTGAFGANTKAKFTDGEGHYYTTMFTTFPYQLLDGVKAYYLPADIEHYDEELNSVKFVEIEGNVVHENTAVILECTATQNEAGVATEVNNRLLPLPGTAGTVVPSNLLTGYASTNGSTVENVDGMYVLSKIGDKLGFFKSSKSSMTPNKAYLDLSHFSDEVNEIARRTTISFGDEEENTPTVITNVKKELDEDAPIYDLMGRRVKNAVKGIYIQNGKKFIKK